MLTFRGNKSIFKDEGRMKIVLNLFDIARIFVNLKSKGDIMKQSQYKYLAISRRGVAIFYLWKI